MSARDLRVAVSLPRLKRGNALRTLIIISALLSLTACTTTTTSSSSGNQLSLNPKNTLTASSPQTTTDKAPATLSAAETATVAAAPAGLVAAADISVDIQAPAENALMLAEQRAESEDGQAAPSMTLIDAEACTRGLRGELATVRAGNSLLSDNGLDDQELAAEARVNPMLASASVMAAPSAGAAEAAAMASPAALHVKLGQTEGLLVAAYQQTGRGYKVGGQAPASGFDASGFTRWVYSQRGLNLPREAKKQAAGGRQVAKEELRPGDLLVYRDPQGKGEAEYHVGIYTGQGNFLHAASKAGVVTETAAFGPQYAPYFVGGRRYYDDPKAAPLSDNQKMAAASSAVKLALSELGPNDKPDRSVIKSKSKSKSKKKK